LRPHPNLKAGKLSAVTTIQRFRRQQQLGIYEIIIRRIGRQVDIPLPTISAQTIGCSVKFFHALRSQKKSGSGEQTGAALLSEFKPSGEP
jgi:hypothetical protein